ncbi:hypothetical protein [Nocardia pseudobrasiliensis]|uniref:Uncharacterized protein n=1 Tax=Nocardia pseudobrasiliensis TaxID=45979 RepID=A0A370I4V0_9NOCA|nr:hypothetical protein [Nocardia pseudobrasiliensis]RDI65742.1 hypothetical protein DFR76_10557 [Nocardia pseudobrasiliensis]
MSLFVRPGPQQVVVLLRAVADAVRNGDAGAAQAAVGCGYLHGLTDVEIAAAIECGRAETPIGGPVLSLEELRRQPSMRR